MGGGRVRRGGELVAGEALTGRGFCVTSGEEGSSGGLVRLLSTSRASSRVGRRDAPSRRRPAQSIPKWRGDHSSRRTE